MNGSLVLYCDCFSTRPGEVFSWWRDMNHTDACRAWRRAHPECIEKVKQVETETMLMSKDDYDKLYAFEPVSAWRWRWKQPMTRWKWLERELRSPV